MRAAIYCRISTKDKGQSHDLQLLALRPFIESRGWQLVGVYSDTISGTKDSRPELDKLMLAARQRKIDVICVWKFDRFARSVSHLVRAAEEFQALGVQFVSLTEQLDTSTPMGKALFGIMATMAQLERDLISERVKTKVGQIIASGKAWGAPRKVWRRDEALADLATGESLRKVAAKYGISHTSLRREANRKVSP